MPFIAFYNTYLFETLSVESYVEHYHQLQKCQERQISLLAFLSFTRFVSAVLLNQL